MKLSRVYLEITNVCNLSCPFCPKTVRPARFMTEEEFRTAIRRIRPYTDYLYLHVMGEPLLHPALPALLAYAREAGMHTALTTNGTLLKQNTDMLLQAGLYKLSISLHAWEANFGTEFTEKASSYYESCFSAARLLAQNGTITALRLWNEDRADRPGQNALNETIRQQLCRFFPQPWTDTPRGIRLQPLCFLEKEEIFDWPHPDAPDTSGPISCRGTRDHVGILADGTVVPCCLDSEGRIPLGSIFTDDLGDILHSPRVCAMRDGFLHGKCTESLCRRCGFAAHRL